MNRSHSFRLVVSGEYACFTRPEMKVERVSYEVMTPSAARGILEAVLWKPAIRWIVTRIDVMKPIHWVSLRRNEVASRISAGTVKTVMKKNAGRLGMYVDEGNTRQQRAGLFLRDVSYVIHAQFQMTDRAGKQDSIVKFENMFRRRAERGQCFHRPYLGCREFAADFSLLSDDTPDPQKIDLSKDLGWMLYDLDFAEKIPAPLFFHAVLEEGSLDLEKIEVRK